MANIKFDQAAPARAIYYEVCYRKVNGGIGSTNEGIYAERKHAEMHIELAKAKGGTSDYFIATLSVPVSETEVANG